jgi:ABC-type Fe3+ transport system substrate-binding protein
MTNIFLFKYFFSFSGLRPSVIRHPSAICCLPYAIRITSDPCLCLRRNREANPHSAIAWCFCAIISLLISTPLFASQKLTIISPHWEGIQREYAWAFEKWYKETHGEEIKVEWLDQGGTSDDFRFIVSEFSKKPNGIGVDMFWGGGTDPYAGLADKNLLLPYKLPPAILDSLPATACGVPLYHPQYAWYGSALSGFGILRNKVVIDMMHLPEVKTWEDLAKPEYRTWVGGADPRSSGSAHMLYEVILQAYGWEKGWQVLTLMSANIRSFSKGANQTPKDVAVGEVACGLAIDLYAWTQIAEVGKDRLDFILPEGLTVINPDAIAMLKGAPNEKAAKAFLEFVMGPQGQALLVLPVGTPNGPQKFLLGRMPVLPSIFTNYKEQSVIKLNPFTYTKSFSYNSPLGSSRWTLVNDLIGTLFIDLHQELAEAWKLVIKKGCPADQVQRLVQLPATQAELTDLAKKWNDQSLRNKKIADWTAFTQKKYKNIIKEMKK